MDAYRAAPGEPLARPEGKYLLVQRDARLPHVCLLCGGEELLRRRVLRFGGSSPDLVVGAGLFGIVGMLIHLVDQQVQKRLPAAPTLEYSACRGCERGALEAEQNATGLKLAVGVVLLGVATAGFNGARVIAAGILLIGGALIWLGYRKLVQRRRFIARLDRGGIVLGNVHHVAAQKMLVARLGDDLDDEADENDD